jgi:cyclopropane fatty-acyl-phospholipid synthase-like methyltransferase
MTISTSQFEWGTRRIKEENLGHRININLLDYREFTAEKWGQFDKITNFEMSEHVGVRNYQTYMAQVKALLKPDGLFFLQIAGLRRAWQYEDLIWGIFMGKYIFPGADASCPMYWNANQLERGGFEVMSVRNQGVHYAHTIEMWYHNIVKNKEEVLKKYGVFAYRLHELFLAWSTMIARQGSSTVWIIISTHAAPVDKYSMPARGGAILDRSKQFIDKKRYTTAF